MSLNRLLPLMLLLLLLFGCSTPPGATETDRWVEKTLADLTLREKVGQMLVYYTHLNFMSAESDKWQEIEAILQDEGIGTLHVWGGPTGVAVATLNELQERSKVPILVQADLEYGLKRRFPGGTHLPWPMGLAATGDPAAAYDAGYITAVEGRALGIHLALAPVVDVNNNPYNPIINTRSFGEDPEWVGTFGNAFLSGLHDGGMAGTAKHFPGHGDTRTDSHTALARIPSDSARLWNVELKPFQMLVDADVDVVMVGHLDAGDFQREPGIPSSLSPFWLKDVLRDQMDFQGVVMTDNMGMGGITRHYSDRYALIETIKAGADIILQNYQYRESADIIEEAIHDGLLSEERIDASVRRILRLKASLGLNRDRYVDFNRSQRFYGTQENQEKAANIMSRAVTLVKDDAEMVPLPWQPGDTLHFIDLYDRPGEERPSYLIRNIVETGIPVESHILDGNSQPADYAEVLNSLPPDGAIVLNTFCSFYMNKDRIFLPDVQKQFVIDLAEQQKRLLVNSFGTPYLLHAFPSVPGYLAAYDQRDDMQEAVAAALLGQKAIQGKLPITIPDIAERGTGLTRPVAPIELPVRDQEPAAKGEEQPRNLDVISPEDMGGDAGRVMKVMNRALAEQAWPGGVIIAGKDGQIFLYEAFGKHIYGDERETYRGDVFDLASVSKVIGTTSAAMKLYEEGRLNLDTAVVAYIPEFVGPDSLQTEWKKLVTPRHLLTHTSGLAPFRLFFKMEAPTLEARFDSVFQSPLDTLPGIQYAYSDIGMITMGKIVERITGLRLDAYLEQAIFEPLGMTSTGYLPTDMPMDRIVPTEHSDWAEELIHGYVHDENSHSLGGVTGHAGLFSTAMDLARYCQMILNGGILDSVRVLQPETIAEFIHPAGIVTEGYGSTRTLGWGGPWEDCSGGIYVDSTAIGHTGYTGTSVWIDPGNSMYVVLLTNAVHPHRTWKYPNYFDWRERVHAAVYESIGVIEPNPKLYWSERWQREQQLDDKGWFAHWQYKRWVKKRLRGRLKF